MNARAEGSVFWPGITKDLQELRNRCHTCNRNAPSNPNPPPTQLKHPDYPFQMVCADFFQLKGVNYLVIVDRYSNWPNVLKISNGGSSKEFIDAMKVYCQTFGIPEELSSDGGSQFVSQESQEFFKNWGIKHRLSSIAYPHSNCRAEIGVKTMKRLLSNNVGTNGTLNTDKFQRACLQYKNTPDSCTKLSPAQIVFGRSIRDFTPMSPGQYRPAKVWSMTSEMREKALAKRHAQIRERLNEHSKLLTPLRVGDHVYVQNQTGHHPNKWDKSGVVIEVKQYDQYIIKIDGSGRMTLRNRKFLRKFTPYQPSRIPTIPNMNFGSQNHRSDPIPTPSGPQKEDIFVQNNEQIEPNETETPSIQGENQDQNEPINSRNEQPLRRSNRKRYPNSRFKDSILY